MTYPDFITEWLASFSALEDALIEADITEEEALYALWMGGHITAPPWIQERIDNELRPDSETD